MTKTIVVGAGIAGLWLAEQLALKGDTVTVLEKANYLGGRILTSDFGYEIGAGRIATTHKRVLALLDRFKIKTHLIGGTTFWISLNDPTISPNSFNTVWDPLIKEFKKSLSPEILATHTLRELANKILGPKMTESILIQFGYRAETEVLRADLAINSFQGEMGQGTKFVTAIGGLSQMIAGLAAACKSAGVTIVMNQKVKKVENGAVTTEDGARWIADRIVLAIPVSAYKHLKLPRPFKALSYLRMEPLTRIYAKMLGPWPIHGNLITDSPLRFIIPIVPELGIVMISYTESQDTKAFKGLKGLDLVAALQAALDRLLPASTILWATAYEWSDGCTYWLPGNYDPEEESKKALKPFPGLEIYCTNESFSMDQAWMEGALDHTAALFKLMK